MGSGVAPVVQGHKGEGGRPPPTLKRVRRLGGGRLGPRVQGKQDVARADFAV